MIYFGYFSFSTIHLELKRQIRLYAPVVPLNTIPDLRPMVKVYTRFQTKTAENHTLWGGTYLYSLYRGVPPTPRPGDLLNCSLGNHCSRIQYCPYSLNIVPYPAISTMTSCLLAFRGLQLRFHKCYHVRINRD